MKTSQDVAVVLERLARVVQNEAHADGLKPTQWEALRYLARANRFSRTPSGLTAYLGVTKGTVSQTLNALERKGIVTKTADAADRRQVCIDVTRHGSTLLERDPLGGFTRAASALTATECDRFAENLEALLKEVLRQRGGRPFGVCKTCRHFRPNDAAGAPHRCALLDVPLSIDDSSLICAEQSPTD